MCAACADSPRAKTRHACGKLLRILMLPCHEVLEADEIRILRGLGHDVFSPGSFVEPQNRGDQHLRPKIDGLQYDPETVAAYHALHAAHPGQDQKGHLAAEFVRRFDVVIVHHIPEWVANNWDAFRAAGVLVIWRTIGQSIAWQEALLQPYREQGLKIVRYSPAEERIPGYIGADAMIRFGKNKDEWSGWHGSEKAVLHVGQDVIKRRENCSYDFYESVTRPFPRTLIGNGSEVVPWGRGKVPYAELKEALRSHRVFFFTGTHPASYTLGYIEAMLTGIPVVSIGPNHGNNTKAYPGHRLFEVPELLNGENGLASDDPFELHEYIQNLLTDHDFAKRVGARGRHDAIRWFDEEDIASQWGLFLRNLTGESDV